MNTEQSKYLKLNYAQYIQLTGIDKKNHEKYNE